MSLDDVLKFAQIVAFIVAPVWAFVKINSSMAVIVSTQERTVQELDAVAEKVREHDVAIAVLRSGR